MLKRFAILLLDFGAGVAGNLVAGWIQQDQWANVFTPPRVVGTLAGVVLMTIVLVLLESEQALPWNWRWHRFWYLHELLDNRDVRRWERGFARLELAQRRRKAPGAEVIVEGERRDLVELLRNLVAGGEGEVARALVLGQPGSGKTTGLERITLELARESVRRLGFGHRMPVLVRLGNFQSGDLLYYVGHTMRHATKGRSGTVLGKGIKALAQRGCVVLLFDALDEALGQRREVVLAELAELLGSRTYEKAPVVVTSRTREDPGGRLAGLQMFQIQDLSDEAVEVFIEAYRSPEHGEHQIWDRLESHGLLEPHGMGRNPFWLRLIVESGAFEGNKGQILNQAVDTLLAREWDQKPEVKRSWRRLLPRDEQLQETKQGLAWLGYQMSMKNQVSLERDEALRELRQVLARRIGVEVLRPQDLLGLGGDAQVLVYEPGPVRFRHRLLQEFATAWALNVGQGLRTQEFFEQAVRETERWDTLTMLAGLPGDHTGLIRAALHDGGDGQFALLAAALIRIAGSPDHKLEQQVKTAVVESLGQAVTLRQKQAAVHLTRIAGDGVVEALEEVLQEQDSSVKERAVEILGEIGSRKAAQVLSAGLRDAALAYVAKAALVSIGKLAVEPLLAAMKDEQLDVRDRAVEALERISEPAVEPLIGVLRDQDSDVRSRAAAALGRIQDIRAVAPLIAGLKDYDEEVRGRAAEALGYIKDVRGVEPLIGVLRDQDSDVRSRAAAALGRIQDIRAVAPLIAALKDYDEEVRGRAAEALGYIKDVRGVEPLIAALRDDNGQVRALAAEALSDIRHAGAVAPLIKVLDDQDSRVRRAATHALERIGEPTVEPLVDALKDEHIDVRDASPILAWIGKPAVEPLIRALEEESPIVRARAALVLGKIGDMQALQQLASTLDDQDKDVRRAGAWALGRIGDAQAFEPLAEALKDEDAGVRLRAVWALGQIGDRRAVGPLGGALNDEDTSVRLRGVWALAQVRDADAEVATALTRALTGENGVVKQTIAILVLIGEPAVEPLIGALKDENMHVRRGAAEVLGRIKDARAVEPLIHALRDQFWLGRCKAAEALGNISCARAVKPLLEALRDEHRGVRGTVAEALGKIGDVRAVDPLLEALEDDDWLVRGRVAEALGKIGDVRALDPLLEALKDENRLVRLKASDALGRIGRPAVERLLQLLNEGDANLQEAAAWALTRLSDPKALPSL